MMRRRTLLWLLCLFTVLPGFAIAQAGISGQVTDQNGVAIPGASVIITGTNKGTATSQNGRYAFGNLAPGEYQVEARFIGYTTQSASITLTGIEVATLDFQLPEASLMLEGLVVTAQKRSQAVQDVPVAITSVDGEFLSKTGIFEMDVFSDYVPGLQVQIQSVNNPGFVIRGITSDNGDSRIEPRVSVFQDGVSISKSRGSIVEMYDLERVEVLKGPQGTLFGRGAQIGAVHLIQNKAKNETSGELTLGAGNLGQYLARGYVNTPLVKDKLFFRLAGIYNTRDGFIENLSGGNLNGKETVALRSSLRYLASKKTVADLIFNYQRDTPPGTSFKSGTFAPAGGDTSPFTFADLERGEDLFINRTVWGSTLLVNHTFNSAWDLTSITAFREFDSVESFDADGTVAPALWFAEEAYGRQFSQELRLSYNTQGRFSGFFGANYFFEDGRQRVPFETDERSLFALFSPLLGGLGVPNIPMVVNGQPNLMVANNPLTGQPFKTFHRESSTNFGTNYAFEVFADGTLKLTDRLNATAGLRATFENITGALEVTSDETPGSLGLILNVAPNNLFAPTNGRLEANETFQSMVGRFALDYKASDAVNVFASVSRGRRPNVVQVLADRTDVLNAETVWSYELGFKTLWLNNRFQFDINGFIYDYSNFQTSIATFNEDDGLVILTRDDGSASALGLETNLRYAVSNKFSFFANYGFIDASFNDTDSRGNEQRLAGNRFRLTPKHSFSAGFDLNIPLGGSVAFFLRPTYTYKSQVFFEEENQPGVEQDGYGLLNVFTGVRFGNKYDITFYANNLLDAQYLIDAGNTGGAFGIPTFIAGPPRLFGVRLTGRF